MMTASFRLPMLLVSVILLMAWPTRSEPPPEAFLLVSGETVRTGGLPEQVLLPDGTLTRGDLEPLFSALPLDDATLYLWSSQTSSVLPLADAVFPYSLAHATVAVYLPSTGLLQAGIVTSAVVAHVADAQVEMPLGNSGSLASLLVERGSFAVFNPSLLREFTNTPEPTFTLLLAIGVGGLLVMGRIGPISRT